MEEVGIGNGRNFCFLTSVLFATNVNLIAEFTCFVFNATRRQ